MEKLTEGQQQALKKTATDRLQARLMKLGWEEKVFALNREALLAVWADLTAQGKDKPHVEPVGAGAGVTHTLSYDPDLERRRLDFEIHRHGEEMKIRREELKLREERHQSEAL